MVTVRGKQVHFHRIGFGELVLLLHGNVSLGEEMIRCVTVPGHLMDRARPAGLRLQRCLVAGSARPGGAGGVDPRLRRNAADRADGDCRAFPGVRHGPLFSRASRGQGQGSPPHLSLLSSDPASLDAGPAGRRGTCRRSLVRHLLLPVILPLIRQRLLRGVSSDGRVPASLSDFPVAHATRSKALLTAAAELRQFNSGMRSVFAGRRLSLPSRSSSARRNGRVFRGGTWIGLSCI